jgi:hypothetical protein
MEGNYKTMQTENYALKEYVIHLQSRLLDTQGEYPQPPPNVNLSHPHAPAPGAAARTASEREDSAPGPSLEAVAQAVASLGTANLKRNELADGLAYSKSAYKAEREDDARTAAEISRQLQPDGPPAAPM